MNPANDYITVEAIDGSSVSVYNTFGIWISRGVVLNGQANIDLSALTKGVYFIEIKNSDNLIIKKIAVR